ncbi:hypothetical protein A33Q_1872 [Indibacter alkaliphilus LW1]|jgi:hypothetical protein|uniref:Uncharacterized protein n=1 Tax=Indibacter alkaliphilus (strain CCUG 57479 / KCTC 22604 / LW1) TaxID=1189612 RepID=S2DDG3_INDAL|nr:hypothetical protein [Indibacter alkaliphilus]EOZ96954.1 hypothetical protein A33Q_1872 [Indibacter alkaliphilus LW1]
MSIKYTKSFLDKLENIFAASEYILRYEKGNFKSGYCILKESKIVIINKYYTLDGKINTLIDIIKDIGFKPKDFEDKKIQDLIGELQQTELKL